MHDVKIAVIGGSGLYHLDNLEIVEEVNPETVNVNGAEKRFTKGTKVNLSCCIALGLS